MLRSLMAASITLVLTAAPAGAAEEVNFGITVSLAHCLT